ncbi:unnamed protein product [Rotaria socialis]|uniref:Uncharacterized protein n=1 Tax=Rotaria socialis TaxID=392032 RepID=A0A820A8X5_9BILA|nr:unnamed protein product [Rotaria socialis]CAF4181913.1 unnamed protein product [Rotaria socialis]CAF4445692.1 unnamed protein product [Rotaria socialis]CAF4475617.1 unnamed protein product [Rotaria socialis]
MNNNYMSSASSIHTMEAATNTCQRNCCFEQCIAITTILTLIMRRTNIFNRLKRCKDLQKKVDNITKIIFVVAFLITFLPATFVLIHIEKQHKKTVVIKIDQPNRQHVQTQINGIYENLIKWNRTYCSSASDRRGPHQKVIAISIYGKQSKSTNNEMYSWETSIVSFFKPLVSEITELLPQWVLRIYIDFAGSTESQRNIFYNFSNVDICDISNIPVFGSSLRSFLPGKMWRFMPIFDPFVDYLLSRDLDSPMTQRETETIDIWLSNEQEKNFFYIARDNVQHGLFILGGLWGASLVRARQHLIQIFQPMLIPRIARRYIGKGDQRFLNDYVGKHVRNNSLIFDSYFCTELGGQPYPSKRPMDGCFLGCIRPCCDNQTNTVYQGAKIECPMKCRPKEHLDWIYC